MMLHLQDGTYEQVVWSTHWCSCCTTPHTFTQFHCSLDTSTTSHTLCAQHIDSDTFIFPAALAYGRVEYGWTWMGEKMNMKWWVLKLEAGWKNLEETIN